MYSAQQQQQQQRINPRTARVDSYDDEVSLGTNTRGHSRSNSEYGTVRGGRGAGAAQAVLKSMWDDEEEPRAEERELLERTVEEAEEDGRARTVTAVLHGVVLLVQCAACAVALSGLVWVTVWQRDESDFWDW